MKGQLFSVIAALVAAIMGAVLSLVWPNDVKVMDSVYLGLLAYLATSTSIILSNTGKLNTFDALFSEVKLLSNHLRLKEAIIKKGNRTFDLFWSLSLLKAQEGIYKLSDSGDFIISKEQTPAFWLQSIINTDSSWMSTNVVDTTLDWRNGWEQKGLEYQKIISDMSNVAIKRIFIFDSVDVINDEMVIMMKEHKKNGIQVKWVTKNCEKLILSPFKSFEEKINTNDFSIIDSNYLLLFKLSKEKEVVEVRFTKNENLISTIENLYTGLWQQSNDVDDL